MTALLYGLGLQWKLDLRKKDLLLTYYVVPLLFFALMGAIFSSIVPEMKPSLTQSMIVMGVTMGATLGLPVSIAGTYGTDVKKVYRANGVPLYQGLVTMALSALVHLFLMSLVIYLIAPIAFDAGRPKNPGHFFLALLIFIIVSIAVGCVLGLAVQKHSRLTMVSQMVFLPSIMLSGIMFDANLLPEFLQKFALILPATHGFHLMQNADFKNEPLLALGIIFGIAVLAVAVLLKRQKKN